MEPDDFPTAWPPPRRHSALVGPFVDPCSARTVRLPHHPQQEEEGASHLYQPLAAPVRTYLLIRRGIMTMDSFAFPQTCCPLCRATPRPNGS